MFNLLIKLNKSPPEKKKARTEKTKKRKTRQGPNLWGPEQKKCAWKLFEEKKKLREYPAKKRDNCHLQRAQSVKTIHKRKVLAIESSFEQSCIKVRIGFGEEGLTAKKR